MPQFMLGQLPEDLSRQIGDARVLLFADTSRYLAITQVFGNPDSTTVYLLRRASERWSKLEAPTAGPRGNFVSTIRLFREMDGDGSDAEG